MHIAIQLSNNLSYCHSIMYSNHHGQNIQIDTHLHCVNELPVIITPLSVLTPVIYILAETHPVHRVTV